MKWLPLILLFFCACSSIDCPVKTKVRTVYSIRSSKDVADSLRDTLTVATFKLDKKGFRKDTALLSSSTGIVQFSLPVGYTTAEDTLFFVFKNGLFSAIDTVWVQKDNYPHFESVDCKVSYFHRLTTVRSTHYAIDSITIKNPNVTYESDAAHFYLYLKKRH
jgi:hypothetical protein